METAHSVLMPAGEDARPIATLSWIMFAGAAAIFLGVLVVALQARFGGEGLRRRLASDGFIVAAGIVFPIVVLVTLLVYGLTLTGARVASVAAGALQIEVSGEQWWWRVRYPAGDGGPEVATANEIRIPVGREVGITLTSPDVIHSFWVPSLAGKVDMIPGVVNRIRLRATEAGSYRGQCAEYCGGPHALMAFHVVALEAKQFEEWLANERRPAAAPRTDMQKRGEALFFAAGCNGCHTVRGTRAGATIGPDLTHVGSRSFIAAGTMPTGADSLARWIRDNQHLKPNNRMPPFRILAEDELAALGAYLENLK